MHKAIEKVEAYKIKTIGDALTKAQQEYQDAKDSYNDTGYDRYWNKMNKAENMINELKEYMDRDIIVNSAAETKKQLDAEKTIYHEKLKEIKKDLTNKIFYLLKVIPDCSEARSFEQYIKHLDE